MTTAPAVIAGQQSRSHLEPFTASRPLITPRGRPLLANAVMPLAVHYHNPAGPERMPVLLGFSSDEQPWAWPQHGKLLAKFSKDMKPNFDNRSQLWPQDLQEIIRDCAAAMGPGKANSALSPIIDQAAEIEEKARAVRAAQIDWETSKKGRIAKFNTLTTLGNELLETIREIQPAEESASPAWCLVEPHHSIWTGPGGSVDHDEKLEQQGYRRHPIKYFSERVFTPPPAGQYVNCKVQRRLKKGVKITETMMVYFDVDMHTGFYRAQPGQSPTKSQLKKSRSKESKSKDGESKKKEGSSTGRLLCNYDEQWEEWKVVIESDDPSFDGPREALKKARFIRQHLKRLDNGRLTKDDETKAQILREDLYKLVGGFANESLFRDYNHSVWIMTDISEVPDTMGIVDIPPPVPADTHVEAEASGTTDEIKEPEVSQQGLCAGDPDLHPASADQSALNDNHESKPEAAEDMRASTEGSAAALFHVEDAGKSDNTAIEEAPEAGKIITPAVDEQQAAAREQDPAAIVAPEGIGRNTTTTMIGTERSPRDHAATVDEAGQAGGVDFAAVNQEEGTNSGKSATSGQPREADRDDSAAPDIEENGLMIITNSNEKPRPPFHDSTTGFLKRLIINSRKLDGFTGACEMSVRLINSSESEMMKADIDDFEQTRTYAFLHPEPHVMLPFPYRDSVTLVEYKLDDIAHVLSLELGQDPAFWSIMEQVFQWYKDHTHDAELQEYGTENLRLIRRDRGLHTQAEVNGDVVAMRDRVRKVCQQNIVQYEHQDYLRALVEDIGQRNNRDIEEADLKVLLMHRKTTAVADEQSQQHAPGGTTTKEAPDGDEKTDFTPDHQQRVSEEAAPAACDGANPDEAGQQHEQTVDTGLVVDANTAPDHATQDSLNRLVVNPTKLNERIGPCQLPVQLSGTDPQIMTTTFEQRNELTWASLTSPAEDAPSVDQAIRLEERLLSSIHVLKALLLGQDPDFWSTVRQLIGEAQYEGNQRQSAAEQRQRDLNRAERDQRKYLREEGQGRVGPMISIVKYWIQLFGDRLFSQPCFVTLDSRDHRRVKDAGIRVVLVRTISNQEVSPQEETGQCVKNEANANDKDTAPKRRDSEGGDAKRDQPKGNSAGENEPKDNSRKETSQEAASHDRKVPPAPKLDEADIEYWVLNPHLLKRQVSPSQMPVELITTPCAPMIVRHRNQHERTFAKLSPPDRSAGPARDDKLWLKDIKLDNGTELVNFRHVFNEEIMKLRLKILEDRWTLANLFETEKCRIDALNFADSYRFLEQAVKEGNVDSIKARVKELATDSADSLWDSENFGDYFETLAVEHRNVEEENLRVLLVIQDPKKSGGQEGGSEEAATRDTDGMAKAKENDSEFIVDASELVDSNSDSEEDDLEGDMGRLSLGENDEPVTQEEAEQPQRGV